MKFILYHVYFGGFYCAHKVLQSSSLIPVCFHHSKKKLIPACSCSLFVPPRGSGNHQFPSVPVGRLFYYPLTFATIGNSYQQQFLLGCLPTDDISKPYIFEDEKLWGPIQRN